MRLFCCHINRDHGHQQPVSLRLPGSGNLRPPWAHDGDKLWRPSRLSIENLPKENSTVSRSRECRSTAIPLPLTKGTAMMPVRRVSFKLRKWRASGSISCKLCEIAFSGKHVDEIESSVVSLRKTLLCRATDRLCENIERDCRSWEAVRSGPNREIITWGAIQKR